MCVRLHTGMCVCMRVYVYPHKTLLGTQQVSNPATRKDLPAGRAATERFSAQLPRAHWIGPEFCG